jgi:hypothetical protein
MGILTINLACSTLVFGLAAWIYIMPRLSSASARSVLQPILLLHAMRHLGLMFLAPGAHVAGIPAEFAVPAAYGDLLAAILATAALLAVVSGSSLAKPLVWLFTIEGSVDLLIAIALATLYEVAPFMGAAYWIPAFWVPALLVTHYVAFIVLIRYWPEPAR